MKQPGGRPGPSEAQLAQARDLHQLGLSFAQIGQRLSISRTTAANWVRKPAKAKAPAEPVRLYLLPDTKSGVVYERRRHYCARLWQCESDWIVAHGSEQARCPTPCEGLVER